MGMNIKGGINDPGVASFANYQRQSGGDPAKRDALMAIGNPFGGSTLKSAGLAKTPGVLDVTQAAARAKKRAVVQGLLGQGVASTLSTGANLDAGTPLKTLLGS